jgi:hypothetical protein
VTGTRPRPSTPWRAALTLRRTNTSLLVADLVVFDATERCFQGAPGAGSVKQCSIYPRLRPFGGAVCLGLAGRSGGPARHFIRRRRAACAWSSGTILISRGAAWLPADCWTRRLFQEAGRRIWAHRFDAAADRSPLRVLPAFEYPDRWRPYVEPGSTDPVRDGRISELRAEAEDSAHASWRLNDAGRERFERFGRDPSCPLG